jgi:hypothetical protein
VKLLHDGDHRIVCGQQVGCSSQFAIKTAMRMCECSGTNEFAPSVVHIPDGPPVCTIGVSFLSCPYSEKDMAKKLGAKWDVARKAWYVPSGVAISPFARWLPGGVVDKGRGKSSTLGYTCKRTVATTKNKAGRHIGWWEHHMQAGMSTVSAAVASIKAATAGCFAGFDAVATTNAIVDVKAELVAATEANTALKLALAVATEENTALKLALVAATEANVATKVELVAAIETSTAAKNELAAAKEANAATKSDLVVVTEANVAATKKKAYTAVNTVAAASIAAAFTTAAIAAIAISTVAISIATTFDSPTLLSTDVACAAIAQSTNLDSGGVDANAIEKSAEDAKPVLMDGETSHPQMNTERIEDNCEAELQLVAERMLQKHESSGAAAAFAATFAPLEALARGGGFDWIRILDDD